MCKSLQISTTESRVSGAVRGVTLKRGSRTCPVGPLNVKLLPLADGRLVLRADPQLARMCRDLHRTQCAFTEECARIWRGHVHYMYVSRGPPPRRGSRRASSGLRGEPTRPQWVEEAPLAAWVASAAETVATAHSVVVWVATELLVAVVATVVTVEEVASGAAVERAAESMVATETEAAAATQA